MNLFAALHHRRTVLLLPFLAACAGETALAPLPPPVADPTLNQIVTTAPLNASSNDSLIYFSFAAGGVVPRTAAWDVALRRFEVRVNGGISGSGGVTGANLRNNETVSDAQVLAFTPASTLAAFDSVRANNIPASADFTTDRLFENSTGYIAFGGAPSANTAAYWKVRRADGGFALLRAKALVLNGNMLQSVTLESKLQSGTALGAPQEVVATVGGGVHVSLATNSVVAEPSGCNWDVRIAPSFALTVNTACSVGTFPGSSSPTFIAATSASDAPEYGPYLAGVTGPVPASISDPRGPFRYNLEGTRRLHPTFNIFLIQTSANAVFKLQVIDYYNATGASGWPTLRYAKIR